MHIAVVARRKHNISLTPLIDVVFILLVFFMLATSFVDWREIGLATGATPAAASDTPSAVVRVAPDGGLRYDGRGYSADALAHTLRQRQAAGEISAVIVQPAPETTLGPIVAALDALAGAGVGPVALGQTMDPATDTAAATP